MNSAERAPSRILFIATDLSSGGGVNKAIRDQSALLSEQLGADVTVIAARSDLPPSYPFPPKVRLQFRRAHSLLSYFALLISLRRARPDFVISSWTQDNILAVLAFLFSGARVVVVEHTSWYFHGRFIRLLRRLIYPLAWRVLVLNPAELAHYRDLGNVRLLPNVVAARSIPVAQEREKLIVAVGHLEARKNFADAIRAMAKSRLEEDGWSLAIIGEGPEEAALNELIRDLRLSRTSISPPTADIAAWYARSSLTLVTAKLEVFSLVLAEAMLAGVVPIAYAADGPSFILEDFPDQLVPIGDVERMSERMVEFANEADIEPLRAKLRAAIQSRFSPSLVGERWKALLEEAPCQ